MNFIKNKKNHLGIVLYKYSFVFTILFSVIFSTFIYNQVSSAGTEYWGYQKSDGVVFPCGYEEGKLYDVGDKVLEAEEACNAFLQVVSKGSSCLKSTEHLCNEAIYPNPEIHNPGGGTNSNPQVPGSGTGGVSINNKLINPIGPNLDTLEDFIVKIIEIALYVIVPILALMIIYTGFLFVAAQGNPEKLKKAKSALAFTLIGAALILGAFVITSAIKSTVEEIKSNT